MAKYKVTFPVQADFTVEVEANDNVSKEDIIKMLNEDMVWDGQIDYNSDVVRDTLTESIHADDPSLIFWVTDADTCEEVN